MVPAPAADAGDRNPDDVIWLILPVGTAKQLAAHKGTGSGRTRFSDKGTPVNIFHGRCICMDYLYSHKLSFLSYSCHMNLFKFLKK
jgi:hypothetical protein